jgi:phenylalanyl-tRNA synthetase beta chain
LRLAADDERRTTLGILNPIKEEEPRLRTALLPSLLRLARENLRRQAERVRIFEVSCVFRPAGEGELPSEPQHASALLAEAAEPRFWEAERPRVFFEAKGVAERLLNLLGYVAVLQREGIPPYLHPGGAAAIAVGGQVIGAVGELHPETAARFEIEAPTAVLVVDLEALGRIPRRDPQYREVSYHPSVKRDLAVLLDRATQAGEVLEAIRKTGGANLTSAEVFDRWEGRGVPEGKVSLTFRLVFQRADRSLTDPEVAKATDRIVNLLAHRFGGELR